MTAVNRDQLTESAQDFAHRALTAYISGDARVILVNAAFSMEHLCKAYLFEQHPALLMEIRNGQLDSLLHLTGLGSKARKLSAPKTIGAREALSRVEYLLPDLRFPRLLLTELIDVRDGVVHAGYLDATRTRELLIAFLRFSNELYAAMRIAEEVRWASHLVLVTTLISQKLSDIEHEVQRKIIAARARFADLMAEIPKEKRSEVAVARQLRISVTDHLDGEPDPFFGYPDHWERAICPACDSVGAFSLGYVEQELIYSQTVLPSDEIEEIIESGRSMFRPTLLVCGSCDLRLEGADQLRAAGISLSEEIEEGKSGHEIW